MFTHKSARDEQGFALLYFAYGTAEVDARAAAHTIERFGPVEGMNRTVDWAVARTLSAPTNFSAHAHYVMDGAGTGGRQAWQVRTNAPDELLALVLLGASESTPAAGETFAGHKERADRLYAENCRFEAEARERREIEKRWNFKYKAGSRREYRGVVAVDQYRALHTNWYGSIDRAVAAREKLVFMVQNMNRPSPVAFGPVPGAGVANV
ncbi:MAG: hypothetical protein ABI119_13740 [Gemmatimonadaceae bacterium]